MLSPGFEPAIPAVKRVLAYALDCMAFGTAPRFNKTLEIILLLLEFHAPISTARRMHI
jgi:hypothetical protein